MKKGISLIVLVITIIVMIIIAGAIIISLNSSNVIEQSNTAVKSSNTANARSIVALKYAELMGTHYAANPTTKYSAKDGVSAINKALEAANGKDYTYTVEANDTDDGYVLYLKTGNGTAEPVDAVTPTTTGEN